MTQPMGADEYELEYTRGKRKEIISELFKDGPPKESRDISAALMALDGLDRISLTKMRIKSDEGVGNAQVAAASMLAVLLNSPKIKQVGREAEPIGEIPTLDNDLPEIPVIPGELDNSPRKDTYDEFAKRNGLDQN